MTSRLAHFETGRPPEVLNTYVHQEVSERTASMVSLLCSVEPSLPNVVTSTHESVVRSSAPTLIASAKTSKKRIRDTSSSKTSPQVSTSKRKACKPFWNKHSKAWSPSLWLILLVSIVFLVPMIGRHVF